MKKAFTLIELLVVIAIIAILAAILFPVFAQAKAAAKKTASLSNIKQTGTAVVIYSNDQDGYLPTGSGNSWYQPNNDGGWAWDTQPYIKSAGLLLDPSDPKAKIYWETWFDPKVTIPLSYASNAAIKWDGTQNEAVGVMNMNQTWFTGPVYVSDTMVNKPSETILFASRYGGNNIYGPGDLISGNTGWDGNGPQALPDGTRNGQPYTVTRTTGAAPGTDTVNVDNRFGAVACKFYQNNGVFSFVDSHAKAMNPIRTNPSPKQKDSDDVNNMWNYKRS